MRKQALSVKRPPPPGPLAGTSSPAPTASALPWGRLHWPHPCREPRLSPAPPRGRVSISPARPPLLPQRTHSPGLPGPGLPACLPSSTPAPPCADPGCAAFPAGFQWSRPASSTLYMAVISPPLSLPGTPAAPWSILFPPLWRLQWIPLLTRTRFSMMDSKALYDLPPHLDPFSHPTALTHLQPPAAFSDTGYASLAPTSWPARIFWGGFCWLQSPSPHLPRRPDSLKAILSSTKKFVFN